VAEGYICKLEALKLTNAFDFIVVCFRFF